MCRVLEDVESGHCGGAEAVDEKGFEFTFDEVEENEGKGEVVGKGGGQVPFGGAVVIVGEEEGVDQEGSEVFD